MAGTLALLLNVEVRRILNHGSSHREFATEVTEATEKNQRVKSKGIPERVLFLELFLCDLGGLCG
jgi:hypothetical protein